MPGRSAAADADEDAPRTPAKRSGRRRESVTVIESTAGDSTGGGAAGGPPTTSALSRRLRGLAIKGTIASAAMTPLTQLLAAAALSAVICTALWQSRTNVVAQDVTVGGFVAFITAMLMLIAPIRRLADVANPITRGVAALERGMFLMGETPAETGGTHRTERATGAIVFDRVDVRFSPDRPPARW